MRAIKILSVTLVWAMASFAAAETCVFKWDPGQKFQLEWTAFKTTAKTPVKGSFDRVLATAAGEAPTLADWIQSAVVSIDASSVNTGDPARNLTLQSSFFRDAGWLRGHASVPRDGQVVFDLRWGKKGLSLPMTFEHAADGTLTATGSVDLVKLGLQGPLGTLHKACEALHKGQDGVSKTWSEVQLRVTTRVIKECH